MFILLVLFDMVLVLLHLMFGREFSTFNLDMEQNVPTLYQSGKLIIAGVILLLILFRRIGTVKLIWFKVPLSLLLIALGIDELMQIHENVYRLFEFSEWLHPSRVVDLSTRMGYRSSLWILYYLPVIVILVFWGGYWFRHFQTTFERNYKYLCVSGCLFLIILFAEILSTSGSYSQTMYFWLITIEETAEMLFASVLILLGINSIPSNSKED